MTPLPKVSPSNRVDLYFDSWSDFIRQAVEVPQEHIRGYNPHAGIQPYKTHDGYTAETYGTTTWKECVTLARSGWNDAAERIQKFSGILAQRIASQIVQPEARYGYEGIDYDIGRLMDGEPEHWVYWDEPEEGQTKAGHKIVRILYNRCCSGYVSGRTLEAVGAAVATLVQLLDIAGYRTEITVGDATDGTRYSGNHFTIRSVLKKSSEDLDMSHAGFALIHAASYRRIFWSVETQIDPRDGGEGTPEDFPEEMRSEYDIYIEKALYDGYNGARWDNPKQAEVWVLDQLKALGVELREQATC
jgi:hypothetical protein